MTKQLERGERKVHGPYTLVASLYSAQLNLIDRRGNGRDLGSMRDLDEWERFKVAHPLKVSQ